MSVIVISGLNVFLLCALLDEHKQSVLSRCSGCCSSNKAAVHCVLCVASPRSDQVSYLINSIDSRTDFASQWLKWVKLESLKHSKVCHLFCYICYTPHVALRRLAFCCLPRHFDPHKNITGLLPPAFKVIVALYFHQLGMVSFFECGTDCSVCCRPQCLRTACCSLLDYEH